MRRFPSTMVVLVLAGLVSAGVLPARAAIELPAGPATSEQASFAEAPDAPALAAGPVAPGKVRAGDVVELTWRLDDPAVEELELELSVDGGPWRRISPELPGLTRRWAWRVPAGGATSARLRLRVGTRDGEYDLPPSAPFAIRDNAAIARPLAARELTTNAAVPGALRDSRPSLSARTPDEPADAPTRVTLPSPATAGDPILLHSWSPAARTPAGPTGRRPRFAPLRN